MKTPEENKSAAPPSDDNPPQARRGAKATAENEQEVLAGEFGESNEDGVYGAEVAE